MKQIPNSGDIYQALFLSLDLEDKSSLTSWPRRGEKGNICPWSFFDDYPLVN